MSKSDKSKILVPSLNLEDAVSEIVKLSTAASRKFVESVDIAMVLGIDSKQSDQSVKGSLVLPNGSGKKTRIMVFASSEDNKKLAIDLGASYAGLEDMIARIDSGFLDFDCCIATPDVMQKISKVAKKLGPRGLMPSPKNGTVTNDISKAISDALKGRVDFKNDKTGIIHCLAGKVNFDIGLLIVNIKAIVKAVKDAKPDAAKGKYIKAFYISTTMGPSIRVSVESL